MKLDETPDTPHRFPKLTSPLFVLSLSLNQAESSDEKEPHRTFTNRDPNTEVPVTEFSIGRAFPSVAPVRLENNRQEVELSRSLRSVSIDDGQAPGTLNPHAAGRTVSEVMGRYLS
jgi:hypothetical protein